MKIVENLSITACGKSLETQKKISTKNLDSSENEKVKSGSCEQTLRDSLSSS